MDHPHHHPTAKALQALALMLHRLAHQTHAVRPEDRIDKCIFGQDRQRNDAGVERWSIGTQLALALALRAVLLRVWKGLLLRGRLYMRFAQRLKVVNVAWYDLRGRATVSNMER